MLLTKMCIDGAEDGAGVPVSFVSSMPPKAAVLGRDLHIRAGNLAVYSASFSAGKCLLFLKSLLSSLRTFTITIFSFFCEGHLDTESLFRSPLPSTFLDAKIENYLPQN